MMAHDHCYRYLICIPDGAADEPHHNLGGQTPLELADMPVLRRLAAHARVGRAQTIPQGMPAASDVGIMSILGYDPKIHHSGRAPIEAAAHGVHLYADRIAFRCNLVTVSDDATMIDFAGGHPTQSEAEKAIALLQRRLGGDVTFHTGLGYRHLMTAPAYWANAMCTPPHELIGQRADPPTGQASTRLTQLMTTSRRILAPLRLSANQIWLWGQGPQLRLPPITDTLGLNGAIVAAVPVARGLGALAGLKIIDVPSATGWYDTSYEAKRDAAIAAFSGGHNLVVVHVAATDEAGHAGDTTAKMDALASWDRRLLTGLTAYLNDTGAWRMLWIPDHVTSTSTRRHTAAPVPYVLYDSQCPAAGSRPTETATAGMPVAIASSLRDQLTHPLILPR